ncbi:hypothetical protein HER18_05540 [Chryseobacterium sp. NEB161]|nr:hypothetical protein HER18_05540 [Chryseobacterium sp. NEB161]
MESKLNNPKFFKGQGKDKKISGQMTKVFNAFSTQPKTMKMVSRQTGIDRANICRYVAEWKEQNSIQEVRKGLCRITKHRAGYLTTDPTLFNNVNS